MKYLLILSFSLSCLLGSCDRNTYTKAQKIKADGYLVNSLAADGCSWHFEGIDTEKIYAANDASQRKVDAVIRRASSENGMYNIPVAIEYTLTGSKKAIECGWGRKAEVDEINIYILMTRKE